MVIKRLYYITSQAGQDWIFSQIVIVSAEEVEQVEPGECEAGADLYRQCSSRMYDSVKLSDAMDFHFIVNRLQVRW